MRPPGEKNDAMEGVNDQPECVAGTLECFDQRVESLTLVNTKKSRNKKKTLLF